MQTFNREDLVRALQALHDEECESPEDYDNSFDNEPDYGEITVKRIESILAEI